MLMRISTTKIYKYFNNLLNIIKIIENLYENESSLKLTYNNKFISNLKPISWDKPYVEAGAGIENIFKIFRFDAAWRLTHKNKVSDNDIFNKFGVYGSLQLQF